MIVSVVEQFYMENHDREEWKNPQIGEVNQILQFRDDEDFGMGLHGIEEEDAERNERVERDEKLLLELQSKDILPELPHKPIHMLEVVKEQVKNVLSHLNSMGYETLENN